MSQGTPVSSLSAHQSARATLAANIIRLRRGKGWSQEALAFECGLHRTFVAHVERQARNVSLDNIERIAIALGVTMAELVREPPPPEPKAKGKSA
jgi:transcriptional regulator with XRE-family HTH domain